MQKVAVTGNIGSGKTTVCRIFESLGIPVYYADKEAKKFYADKEVKKAVKELFGNTVYDDHAKLQTAELARLAFNDPAKLGKLNDLIHPLVLHDFLSWARNHHEENYIIYESALLFESGFYRHFDSSILVLSPLEIAKERVIKRDGVTAEEFMKRRNKQQSDEEKRALADKLIINDEQTPLIPQVAALHKLYQDG